MPSGPGAEWPEILIALVMSLSRIRQSSEEVGKFGLVWLVLGASLHLDCSGSVVGLHVERLSLSRCFVC